MLPAVGSIAPASTPVSVVMTGPRKRLKLLLLGRSETTQLQKDLGHRAFRGSRSSILGFKRDLKAHLRECGGIDPFCAHP